MNEGDSESEPDEPKSGKPSPTKKERRKQQKNKDDNLDEPKSDEEGLTVTISYEDYKKLNPESNLTEEGFLEVFIDQGKTPSPRLKRKSKPKEYTSELDLVETTDRRTPSALLITTSYTEYLKMNPKTSLTPEDYRQRKLAQEKIVERRRIKEEARIADENDIYTASSYKSYLRKNPDTAMTKEEFKEKQKKLKLTDGPLSPEDNGIYTSSGYEDFLLMYPESSVTESEYREKKRKLYALDGVTTSADKEQYLCDSFEIFIKKVPEAKLTEKEFIERKKKFSYLDAILTKEERPIYYSASFDELTKAKRFSNTRIPRKKTIRKQTYVTSMAEMEAQKHLFVSLENSVSTTRSDRSPKPGAKSGMRPARGDDEDEEEDGFDFEDEYDEADGTTPTKSGKSTKYKTADGKEMPKGKGALDIKVAPKPKKPKVRGSPDESLTDEAGGSRKPKSRKLQREVDGTFVYEINRDGEEEDVSSDEDEKTPGGTSKSPKKPMIKKETDGSSEDIPSDEDTPQEETSGKSSKSRNKPPKEKKEKGDKEKHRIIDQNRRGVVVNANIEKWSSDDDKMQQEPSSRDSPPHKKHKDKKERKDKKEKRGGTDKISSDEVTTHETGGTPVKEKHRKHRPKPETDGTQGTPVKQSSEEAVTHEYRRKGRKASHDRHKPGDAAHAGEHGHDEHEDGTRETPEDHRRRKHHRKEKDVHKTDSDEVSRTHSTEDSKAHPSESKHLLDWIRKAPNVRVTVDGEHEDELPSDSTIQSMGYDTDITDSDEHHHHGHKRSLKAASSCIPTEACVQCDWRLDHLTTRLICEHPVLGIITSAKPQTKKADSATYWMDNDFHCNSFYHGEIYTICLRAAGSKADGSTRTSPPSKQRKKSLGK